MNMQEQDSEYQQLQDQSILFADIQGFSRLKPFQQRLYIKEVLGRIAEAISSADHKPQQANTWGDGLVAFFSSHTSAIRCALALRDIFRVTDWESKGLPALRIRISLHAGEVFVGKNPVTNSRELIGTEVNRAARIEPIVAPNHVYATKDLAQRCKVDAFKFHHLGSFVLPKGWGAEDIYAVSWAHEVLDSAHVRSASFRIGADDLSVLHYPSWSKFGRRMSISTHAKATIATYCTSTKFWKPEDVVFIESGTLPVFMVLRLYHQCDPLQRPRLIITNNLGCLAVAMMAEESGGESYALFPDDAPMNCILIGGGVLDDYAATIPEDLIGAGESPAWETKKMVEYLRGKAVNHVIMMMSKLTCEDGPCAVSSPMRRFKKLMLRYVTENASARLSILGEADKLVGRRGWPADTIDLPGVEASSYWPDVLRGGRTEVIAAISPEMSVAEIGLAKREIRALRGAGAVVTLLDKEGNIVILDD